jgi:predicted porin
MNKLVKMSLVAAVAVSTLNAGSLEEAIKGVDVSGDISIGYNNYDQKEGTAQAVKTNESEYDFYIKAVVPVNDNITYTASAENDYAPTIDAQGVNNVERTLYLKESYFTYANGGVTVMAGKQGVKTPWTSSVRGSGVVGMYNAGPVTIAAAHFENVTLLPTDSVSAAALIGSFAGVNASLWAVDTSAGDGYSIDVNGKIMDMVSYDVRHTTFEKDAEPGIRQDEFELTKIVLGAAVGPVNLTLGYGMTNDVNNGAKRNEDKAHGVALNKDNGESADLYMDQARLDDLNDAKAWVIGASMPVGAWTFGAMYLDAESDDVLGEIVPTFTADVTELNVTVKYAMSKNFSITGLYSDYELDATGIAADKEDKRMELSLNYSF